MRYFSVCSGIGGFEIGIDSVIPEAECVGFAEVDKYASSVYRMNFWGVKNYGNVTTIKTDELPNFDLLVGGFPCQAFSVAGLQRGFEDSRGTILFDIARILHDKKPKYFLLENVKGLLSHEGGDTFTKILGVLTDLGYVCQSELLNSRYFSVPQNRERIFIFGTRGESRPKIFPLREDGEEFDGTQPYVSSALDANYWKGSSRGYGGSARQLILHNVYGGFKEETCRMSEDVCPTIRTPAGGGHIPMVMATLTPDRAEKRQNGRRFKTDEEPMFTLTGQDIHGITMYNGEYVTVRKLTPTECERLQGFPDGWTEYGTFEPPKIDKPCARRNVYAIIVNGNRHWVGTNWCENPQEECPRTLYDGVYTMCREVCGQKYHAETDALRQAGKGAEGGTIYLIGHDFFCDSCVDACRKAGIKRFVVNFLPKIPISDTQRYKMLGNAVTTTVIESIMDKLVETENVG